MHSLEKPWLGYGAVIRHWWCLAAYVVCRDDGQPGKERVNEFSPSVTHSPSTEAVAVRPRVMRLFATESPYYGPLLLEAGRDLDSNSGAVRERRGGASPSGIRSLA